MNVYIIQVLNGISEINQLFDDILIIWPAPVYIYIYIYINAFIRRFYPKRLTVHSGYTIIVSECFPWELNPWPFALLTQCSTTEPQ